REFEVAKGASSVRIDQWVTTHIEAISRNRVQQAAKAGCLRVNGVPVKSNYKIRPLDKIVLLMADEPRDSTIVPTDIPLDIRYEDEDLIIVHKPAGLVVHPGYGHYTDTLCNGLAFHYQNLPSPIDFFRPGIVHRLDKDTTGVMVVAKTENAMTNLAKQFFDRTVHRRYVALIWGDPEEEVGFIEGNLGRHPRFRQKMTVFEDADQGKFAKTHYKVIRRYGYVTLVECRLETGRTHQIRAHFQHIGHPLFGDKMYGGDSIVKGTVFSKYKQFVHNCFKMMPRQALHAKSLGIIHPTTNEEMMFECDYPEDLAAVLAKWEKYMNVVR
ncbi:UNVERIFIED_CONTAM: hypothetical protein GTU68_055684, partial [Idotea baltica]|nr:hypothetical protein [Idotea baltica]